VNTSSAQRLMPGHQYPLGLVFLGRRSELTPTISEKLRQMNHQNPFCRVRTLDSLAVGARSARHFTENGTWQLPIPMRALSHADLARGVSQSAQEVLTYSVPDELVRLRRDHRIWDLDE
jgi:hypothetical protein